MIISNAITAGEFRGGKKIISPFNEHVGISIKDITPTNDGAFALTVTPPATAANTHGDVVHGGWTATCFDTLLSGPPYLQKTGGLEDGEYGLTRSMRVEFESPLFVGETYTGVGKIIGRNGNNIQTIASLTNSKGKKVATAEALFKARRADWNRSSAGQLLLH